MLPLILLALGAGLIWWSMTAPISTVTGYGDKLRRFAEAIAKAEGFGPAGNLATRANNPGNLKAGDKGLGLIAGKTVFGTVADGWAALTRQINLMVTGASAFYKPDMTIREIAVIYTGGDKPDAWTSIVARQLGVTPDTTLREYFG